MNSFRLDRFLTLYFFYPLLRILPQERNSRIPILMYHSISDDKMEGVHPYYETNTSPKVFTDHMKFLYENNYKVINLDQALRVLKSSDTSSSDCSTSRPLSSNEPNQPNEPNKPQRYVVLTFDDGLRDFYINAFPILEKYDFTAAMFLSTAFIDNQRLEFIGKECLIWEEVRELRKKGILFGSHTVNHPKLYILKRDEIEVELRESKEKIEDEIGASVDSFSYPFAFPEQDKKFTKEFKNVLTECGYKYGITTIIGTAMQNNDIYFLKRIPVNSFDDLILFKAKLQGGYNWAHKYQYLFKLLKKYQKGRDKAKI